MFFFGKSFSFSKNYKQNYKKGKYFVVAEEEGESDVYTTSSSTHINPNNKKKQNEKIKKIK